jgi:hypothetical protein
MVAMEDEDDEMMDDDILRDDVGAPWEERNRGRGRGRPLSQKKRPKRVHREVIDLPLRLMVDYGDEVEFDANRFGIMVLF